MNQFYNDEEEMLLDIPIINPPAFEDEYIETKVHKIIEGLGVTIHWRCMAQEIIEDENNHIKQVIFKKLNVVEMDHEEEEEEEEMEDED